MGGELIVRIFLYGLILVVPQVNDPSNANDDTLVALLVRAADHAPLLHYCKKFKDEKGKVCEPFEGEPPFDLAGWIVTFAFGEGTGARAERDAEAGAVSRDSSSPLASASSRRYHCRPNDRPHGRGTAQCDSNGDPPMVGHPMNPNQGTDFDWAASLEEVLGSHGPIGMDPDKIYTKVELSRGTVGVCEFVKVREKCLVSGGRNKFVVPLVEFGDSETGSFTPRAVAQSLVVELTGDEAESFLVELEKLDGLETHDPISPARRPCSGHGRSQDECIELSISNLPDPPLKKVHCGEDISDNIKDLTGDHWERYYGLLTNVQGPTPRPVRASSRGDLPVLSDVAPSCPVFPPRKLWPFREKKTWSWQLHRDLLSTEDRPICPVGTP